MPTERIDIKLTQPNRQQSAGRFACHCCCCPCCCQVVNPNKRFPRKENGIISAKFTEFVSCMRAIEAWLSSVTSERNYFGDLLETSEPGLTFWCHHINVGHASKLNSVLMSVKCRSSNQLRSVGRVSKYWFVHQSSYKHYGTHWRSIDFKKRGRHFEDVVIRRTCNHNWR